MQVFRKYSIHYKAGRVWDRVPGLPWVESLLLRYHGYFMPEFKMGASRACFASEFSNTIASSQKNSDKLLLIENCEDGGGIM